MHHLHTSWDSLHGELPHRTRSFDIGGVMRDVGGFFKGAGEGLKETGEGIVDAVTSPIDTAKGVGRLVTQPTTEFPKLWDAVKDPVVDDWKRGNEGEAIGRVFVGVVEAVAGTKGITKVAKVGRPRRGDRGDAAPEPAKQQATKPEHGTPRDGSQPRPAPKPESGSAPVGQAATSAAMLKLDAAGVKHNPIGDVVFADELPPNSIIDAKAGVAFLEVGSANAGLRHILYGKPNAPGHLEDFAKRGVEPDDVPKLIRTAIQRGDVQPGSRRGSYDISVAFQGTQQRLRVAIGNNGFIVSAYPI